MRIKKTISKTISIWIITLVVVGCSEASDISPGNCTFKVYEDGKVTSEERMECSISGVVLTGKDRAEGTVGVAFNSGTGKYTAWVGGEEIITSGEVKVTEKIWTYSAFGIKIAEVVLD